jgi:hypothetical protein
MTKIWLWWLPAFVILNIKLRKNMFLQQGGVDDEEVFSGVNINVVSGVFFSDNVSARRRCRFKIEYYILFILLIITEIGISDPSYILLWCHDPVDDDFYYNYTNCNNYETERSKTNIDSIE